MKTTTNLLNRRRILAAEAIRGACGLCLAVVLGACSAVIAEGRPKPLDERPATDLADRSPDLDETSITVRELQSHIAFLASDTLEGREAGTAGGRATAAYLADELRRLNYLPIGTDSDYRQPFGAGFQNVLGLLEGSDPQLKNEWVVIGSHFDHVGFGTVLNSHGPIGQIHNGADDNASGVSCLLEIAEALRGVPAPRRSVVVAFWDAEEKGLLGSNHWLANHSDLSRVRFYTNIDMVGRMRDDTAEVFGVRTLPGLRTLLTQSNVSDLQLKFSWAQRDDSDHYNFYQRKIPYAMVFSGLHYDYHRPSDDVEKLNYEGIEKITRVLAQHLTEVANIPEPLEFREACRRELITTLPGTPLPSRLGVTWSPTRQQGQTITITSVEPDSPADKAGLQVGDELVTVNGVDVREIDNFIDWIRRSPIHLEISANRAGDQTQPQIALDLNGLPQPDGVIAAQDTAEPGIAIVTAVQNSSRAAQWGFRQGDRILSVDDSAGSANRRWRVERQGRKMQLPAAEAQSE